MLKSNLIFVGVIVWRIFVLLIGIPIALMKWLSEGLIMVIDIIDDKPDHDDIVWETEAL